MVTGVLSLNQVPLVQEVPKHSKSRCPIRKVIEYINR